MLGYRPGVPLDPVIASILDLMASAGTPSLAAGTPEQARLGMVAMTVGVRDPATLAPVRQTRELLLPGPAGELPARLYLPETDGPVPTVVFFHGGGFVLGDLETHDDHARLLCHQAGVAVLSIDYRLAPEHPFPAAYDDCLAATVWAVEHIAELGGDASRVAVAGDSAGGNLAAAVALRARDAGITLKAQLLLYPATDLREDETHSSRRENAEGFFLTAEDMAWFGNAYVPTAAQRLHPRASVLLEPDLAGVAPAVLCTAEFDPLRDEGNAYAKALAAAGVEVRHTEFAGLIHGFYGMGVYVPAAAAAVAALNADLKTLLG